MTSIVKIHRKGQMTLPTRLRTLAGIAEGDFVEAAFLRGKIVITLKSTHDRSKFPSAENDYTPGQRRIIDARLAEGLADVKAGRVHGPFASAQEASAYVEKAVTAGSGPTPTTHGDISFWAPAP